MRELTRLCIFLVRRSATLHDQPDCLKVNIAWPNRQPYLTTSTRRQCCAALRAPFLKKSHQKIPDPDPRQEAGIFELGLGE